MIKPLGNRHRAEAASADGYGFDWREPWVADEHDKLNRPLFEKSDPRSTLYFSILGDMVREAKKQDILRKGCGILDVGCGAGWQRIYLGMEELVEGLAYTGIDVSERMVALARSNLADRLEHRSKAPQINDIDIFETADVMCYTTERPCCLVMACGVVELFEDWAALVRRMAGFGSKGILLHKIFFDEKETHRELVWSYGGKRELRTFILRNDLERLVNELEHDIVYVRSLDPDGYPNYSVLLKRR